jgi:hypothetical protein
MAFYPLLFGHAECRIDRRDPRPDWLQEPVPSRRRPRRKR